MASSPRRPWDGFPNIPRLVWLSSFQLFTLRDLPVVLGESIRQPRGSPTKAFARYTPSGQRAGNRVRDDPQGNSMAFGVFD